MTCTEGHPVFRRRIPLAPLALAFTVVAHGPAMADEESRSLADAVTAGETHVALRYRFEHVDQDGFTARANASTVRLRLNHLTSAWRGWRAFGEYDYVGELFADNFNSAGGSTPNRGNYPVVADPEGADLNQLYADYAARGWRLRFGRQRILLDDQRYVGGVGWRQNEQTFDAVSAAGSAPGNSEVFYAWVSNANRIFGETVPAGDHRMSTHLLNVRVAVGDSHAVTPYAYYIDNEDDPTASTSTIGVRAGGDLETANGVVRWLAELATQSDAAQAPVDFDARYWRLEAGWQPPGELPVVGLGVASLGGDRSAPGRAFRTPLATLHAFQGWADQFLVTPDAGVTDAYGSIACAPRGWRLEGIFHRFSAEDGGETFGRELDLSATRPVGSRYAVTLKAAFFDGRSAGFVDTTKAWLVFTADY